MGYSLSRTAPNYIGRLTQTQLHFLFDGMNEHEKKKSDHMKKSSGRRGGGGGRQEAQGMGDISRIPGVRVKKKPRRK